MHRPQTILLAPPQDHPLAGGKTALRPAQLNAQPFIALPAGANAAAGFMPDIRYEAAEPSTVMQFISAGLGMAVVRESLRKTAPQGVAFRPIGFFSGRMQIFHVRHNGDCVGS